MEESDNLSFGFHQRSLRKLPEILTLYYGHNMTIKEISNELKMGHVTISRLLKQYGRGLGKRNKAPYSIE